MIDFEENVITFFQQRLSSPNLDSRVVEIYQWSSDWFEK